MEPNENGATPELVARYALAGFYLCTTIESHEALVAGLPVPRNLLKPDRLATIGEKTYGHDLVLTPDLALACELAQQAGSVNGDQPTRTLNFEPLGDFLERDYPPPEPLLGSVENVLYLARSTFLLLYGDGGAGKSTLTIDAAAHLAAGKDWLGINVPRPCRILLIENEGGASLYQAKLQHKVDTWDGHADWAANVLIYTDPWSRYTFASEGMRTELAEYCAAMKVDIVMANPLFGVGGPGSGKPEETGLFVDWMKEIGLWDGGPAFWLLHHQNKLGQISGDWARQPDTIIQLEAEDDQPRSKLTWEKVRWIGNLPEDWRRISLLDWTTDDKGYQPLDVDMDKVTDSQLLQRIYDYLTDHPWMSTTTITDEVQGNSKRQRDLLKEAQESRQLKSEKGPRGSTLWALPETDPVLPVLGGRTAEDSSVLTLEDGRTADTPTPHEQRDSTPSYPQDGREDAPQARVETPSSGTNPLSPLGERVGGRGHETGSTTDKQLDRPDPDADIPF